MNMKLVCMRCLVINKKVKLAYANHLIFLLSRCIIKKKEWFLDNGRIWQNVKKR